MYDKHYHTHIYLGSDEKVYSILRKINNKLNIMATKQEQFDAAVASLTASSANIAADLNNLKQQIADGTVTADSLTALDNLAAAFQGIADSTPDVEPAPVDPTA